MVALEVVRIGQTLDVLFLEDGASWVSSWRSESESGGGVYMVYLQLGAVMHWCCQNAGMRIFTFLQFLKIYQRRGIVRTKDMHLFKAFDLYC